jgi:hypothetical protein
MLHANLHVPLSLAPPHEMRVLEGAPVARSVKLLSSDDGQAFTMIWECSPGKFSWHYGMDETVVLLEGRVGLSATGLRPTEIKAGDVVLFKAGQTVEWTVHEKVRKVAFLRRTLSNALLHRAKQTVKKLLGRT